jgi:AmmeMemoRadiSam system protein B
MLKVQCLYQLETMSSDNTPLHPKLRNIEATPVTQAGQQYILLNDPLRLSDKQIIIPQSLGAFLHLCDGTRDASAISASLAVRYGQNVSATDIEQLLAALNNALLLDNEDAADALQEILSEYRSAPFRTSILAGISYPSDEQTLKDLLDSYLKELDQDIEPSNARGLISPHIDYERGGPVYAQVWSQVKDAVQEAEVAVVFGTDHFGIGNPFTLTRQNYATPYGVLPTDVEIIDALAGAIAGEVAFAQELNHRTEHSIELAAVWLHHMRGGEPIDLVPILCGSLDRLFDEDSDLENDAAINKFLDVLIPYVLEKEALVIAAGDMSHVGPSFGGHPLDLLGRARVKSADDELISLVCEGDHDGFFEAIRGVNDQYNVCGLAPIYMAMRSLAPVEGDSIAYDRCPADPQNTSIVSICGVVLR